MAKFKSNYRIGEVEIPTSALPDIIFMLLFFFMVTTVLREKEDKVKYLIPNAEQLKKIEKKSLITEIKVGLPKNATQFGVEPVIDADGKIIKMEDVIPYVLEQREALPEYLRHQHIVLLKADKDVEMGLVTDLQEELRKANARKIVYASLKEEH